MGSDSSKRAPIRTSAFNSSESEQLDQLFYRISGVGKDGFNLKQFKEFMSPKLSEVLSVRLYAYLKSIADIKSNKKVPSNEDLVTRNGFDSSLGAILKGALDQKAKLLLQLIDEGKVAQFKFLLNHFLHLAESSLSTTNENLSWKFQQKFSVNQLIDHFLFDLVIRDGRQQCDVVGGIQSERSFNVDDVEQWLLRMPLVNQIIRLGLYQCFPIGDISQLTHMLPVCDIGVNSAAPVTLLDFPSVIFINGALPHHLRSEWRLIFCTSLHGASFATMLKKIMNKGPTVFIIKDRGGHVFGGFAAEPWSPNSNFYGSSHCFLFSLLPVMDIFRPTGYNSNFMYINQNQQTLPNGMGMGGQWNYAGIWIDHEFGSGHSRAKPKCSTYNSPQLSSDQEFIFDIIEVWAVGPKPRNPDEEDIEGEDSKKKSALQKMDAETKALLELMGKHQHSEAIREADEKDDEKRPK